MSVTNFLYECVMNVTMTTYECIMKLNDKFSNNIKCDSFIEGTMSILTTLPKDQVSASLLVGHGVSASRLSEGKPTYMAFLNFSRAFDTVWRDVLKYSARLQFFLIAEGVH